MAGVHGYAYTSKCQKIKVIKQLQIPTESQKFLLLFLPEANQQIKPGRI
jgi:hypothetical protein